MIYYKIRKKGTELFLKGTPTYHAFAKDGRVYQKIGVLRSFLTAFMKSKSRRVDLSEIEIIEYELVESAVKGLHEVIKPDQVIELLRK
jgi:hypothetical protein